MAVAGKQIDGFVFRHQVTHLLPWDFDHALAVVHFEMSEAVCFFAVFLDDAVKREKADSFTHFKVYNRERMVEIPWQQARYLMAEHKTVYLFTGDGHSYELPKTLVYWEELLGDKVIRIHRNALVFRHTLDSLIRLDDDENDESASTWSAKILDIPTPLPVSRRQLSTLRKIIKNSI